MAEAEGARGRVAEGSMARLQKRGKGATEALGGALAFIATQEANEGSLGRKGHDLT